MCNDYVHLQFRTEREDGYSLRPQQSPDCVFFPRGAIRSTVTVLPAAKAVSPDIGGRNGAASPEVSHAIHGRCEFPVVANAMRSSGGKYFPVSGKKRRSGFCSVPGLCAGRFRRSLLVMCRQRSHPEAYCSSSLKVFRRPSTASHSRLTKPQDNQ